MNKELLDLLVDLERYMDNKANVDEGKPNEEAQLLTRIQKIMEYAIDTH